MNANCTLEIPMLCIVLCYHNVFLLLFFFYHCARMLGVLSAQRLSHNSAGKLTVFVETNDRSCVLCHYFPFMNGRKREVCLLCNPS